MTKLKKPTVEIWDARIVTLGDGQHLMGKTVGHPAYWRVSPNKTVLSSTILKKNGDIVETRNTIYRVTWVLDLGE